MFDIGIIGAGPAGYTAAIRASQYGLKVVLFEKEFNGGTCLNKGCIPTKAILHSAHLFEEIKQFPKNGITVENPSFDYSLIKQREVKTVEKIRKSLTKLITDYGIRIVEGEAEIKSPTAILSNGEKFECANIIIATGSKPNKFKFNGNYSDDFILTSDDILNLETLPEDITILGSGAIGVEWARILTGFNKKVRVIELAQNLIPLADTEVSERIERIFKRNKIEFYLGTTIDKIENTTVTLTNGVSFETEKVLVAIGRSISLPKTENLTIETEKFVKVDSNFETSQKGIFAIGDVNGVSMLAHSASNQAVQVVEYIKDGTPCSFNKDLVPSVIYGSPEIAWTGKREKDLENIKYKKSVFLMAGLGKAQADDNIEGFIKLLSVDEKIVGAHIVGGEASALLQEILILMNLGATTKDATKIIYAHPTYSEGVLEALEGLEGLSINSPKVKE
ncbi:dihydrolipoyl dehydrogenase [bacterium]|nr:dihydrolipoyl dehydrogenase [bacterium]